MLCVGIGVAVESGMEFPKIVSQVVLLANEEITKTLELEILFKREMPKVIFKCASYPEVRTFISFFPIHTISPRGEVIVLIES